MMIHWHVEKKCKEPFLLLSIAHQKHKKIRKKEQLVSILVCVSHLLVFSENVTVAKLFSRKRSYADC